VLTDPALNRNNQQYIQVELTDETEGSVMTEVMDRVAELDGVIEAKSLEIDNLVTNEVKITDGNMEIPEGVYTQMKTLMEEQKQAEEIKAALQFGVSHAEYKARQKEMEEKGFGDGSSAAMAAAAGLSLGSQQLGMQLKTLGEMFVQS
jgi:mevalonate pyrophosphate decarboxylase